MGTETKGKADYDKRLDYLKTEFNSWRDHFKDITSYLFPRRGRYLDADSKPNDGKKRNENIINGAAGRHLRTMAAGMKGGLTSPARPWYKLTLADKDLIDYTPVKEWLEVVRDRMNYAFQKSNFYDSVDPVYEELGSYGTAAMLIEEDPKSIIRCYPFTIGEYYISTDAELRVNEIYRVYWMQASNVLKAFGEENVSNTVKDTARSQKDEWVRIVHLIEENEDADPEREDNKHMAYKSVYYEHENSQGGKLLRESGYQEFPAMVPRWATTGSEVYGRSPGMEVLGDVKMLQKIETKGLRALDKWLDPPVNAPTELKNKAVTTMVGGVNYINTDGGGASGVQPLVQITPNLDRLQLKIDRVEQGIKEAFFVHLFSTFIDDQNRQKTAYEASKMEADRLSQLGPVVGRFHSEFIEKVIDRTFNIMERNQMFPPPPPELEGLELEIEHISPLAQAQKAVGVTSIEQTTGFIMELAAQGKPEALDKLNADEAIDAYAAMAGPPTKMINNTEELEASRKAKAEAEKAQAMIEQLGATATGVKDLSQINTGENNVVDQMLEGLQ